ncbi:uncharacterized protein LOC131329855 [Rhododendron vialii]|uniref:uncharacterized protein LOC131329855 n=1 Tax=Rhododendron vialii TaxID=182163 RepID=UPI00265DE260|nr:uncharacterized protein LOC131329855 [Rhododendron vialii]
MTFAEFETLFLDKYFPTSLRLAKEQEFLNLKQGTMTVTQYAAKFEELSRYALDSIPNEDRKARRFEWGLTTARKAVVAQAFTTFAEVVKCALRLESEESDFKTRWRKAMGHYKCDCPQLQRERIESFGNQKAQQPEQAGFEKQNPRGPLQQQNGQNKDKQPMRYQQSTGGRIFALQTEAQEQDPSVIQGTLLLYSTCEQALFDSRASHSFISTACSSVKRCELEVTNLRLNCDLGVNDMADFDVILRMNWLSVHQAVIDCHLKMVTAYTPVGNCSRFKGDRQTVSPTTRRSEWQNQQVK